MTALVLFLIEVYQKRISPFLMPRCRFYPSCSEYAKQSFQKYHFANAFYRTVKRLLRCHPGCHGGFDPP
ncbi:MAG: membrane protein insertion efficiency factor YidD [Myxococcaceae bacterium]|nr:membrane protein insertion efficiency factor YidD [Myxococcaceae bacterium]MBH2006036.1 membrane protein insertion efficiency factor YidD [Myxococcaceae bacterium]